eukprot:12424526-Karenia_brevis.AAC.1
MSKKRSDEEIARIVSVVVQAVMPQIQRPSSDDRSEQSEHRSKVVLDEKNFRRMDKFSGDPSVHRMWLFNLGAAHGQVD